MADGTAFQYDRREFQKAAWKRKPRIFISRRFGDHDEFYENTVRCLQDKFADFQNLSIPQDELETGVRGGQLDPFRLKSRIAARLYTCDLVIAPTSKSMSYSEFVEFEIALAALAYSIPIVFVVLDNERQQSRQRLLIEHVGIKSEVVDGIGDSLVESVKRLIGDAILVPPLIEGRVERRTRNVPASAVLNDILNQHPFEASAEEAMRLYDAMLARRRRRAWRKRK